MYKILYANYYTNVNDKSKACMACLIKDNCEYHNLIINIDIQENGVKKWNIDDSYDNDIVGLDKNNDEDISRFLSLLENAEPYICKSEDFDVLDATAFIEDDSTTINIAYCDKLSKFHRTEFLIDKNGVTVRNTKDLSKDDVMKLINKATAFLQNKENEGSTENES